MKTNIKMRVTPEQSKSVQEICFENSIYWWSGRKIVIHLDCPFLFIGKNNITQSENESFYIGEKEEEIDADLFIRTNGTCEEIQKPSYRKTKILNQKKELHKLNLKLQKCISLGEQSKSVQEICFENSINWHIERNESLFAEIEQLKAENKSLKESSKISCNMLHSQKDKIDRLEFNYVTEQSNYKKEIEKLKAVIEYLESKVK